jgi:hypothetical protein
MMEIKAGQWIFTREWQGPVLEVAGTTAKRVTCKTWGGRKAFLEPHRVLAVSDTEAGARAADRAFRDTQMTYKAEELAEIKARKAALTTQQYALEREIRVKAIEEAQAAAVSQTPLQGEGA